MFVGPKYYNLHKLFFFIYSKIIHYFLNKIQNVINNKYNTQLIILKIFLKNISNKGDATFTERVAPTSHQLLFKKNINKNKT